MTNAAHKNMLKALENETVRLLLVGNPDEQEPQVRERVRERVREHLKSIVGDMWVEDYWDELH